MSSAMSAELFEEVVASVATAEPAESQASDRRAPRVTLRTHVTVMPWTGGDQGVNGTIDAPMSVRIRDLSAGGVGILHASRIPLDARLVILLPRSSGEPVPMLSSVAYWEPLAENLHAIGAQFERMLSEEEFADLMSPEEAAPRAGVIARISHAFGRMRKVG